MSFLVASSTAGYVPEKPRNFFLSERGLKHNKIKPIRRSKLPGNGSKYILLSQIRGLVVVLRDRIHKELGNLINLTRIVKLVCFNVLNVKFQVCLNVNLDFGFLFSK